VFVHGAFADSSSWNAEIKALQLRGYNAVAAPDPLRGLSSDSDYVRAYLKTISGPIVLVGHSYGGAVITDAAVGVPNVKALVYVAAFVPDAGESVNDLVQKYPGSGIGPTTTSVVPFADPGAPNGQNVDIYIKQADFRQVFAGDVDAATAADLAATQRPLALTGQLGPSGVPAWKTVPSWDLITLDDHAIPPAAQQAMAARAHAHVEQVHSSHAVMVSHPDAVLGVVLEAAAHAG
jgi:pimeloyl-ACP methyl ester carboxylesterase